ncbi:MAG: GDP-mannose 4,6-dehydratase, partial [Candidatus Brocadiia bacterium]
LHREEPDDFVIATGETHSPRECAELAFRYAGFDIEWQGKGVDEEGIDRESGRTLIRIDPRYFRPAEVDLLLGDATKAREQLGWEPEVRFEELIRIMVEADIKAVEEGREW